MSCLTEDLEGVRELATLFVMADSDVVYNAGSTLTGLRDVGRCSDVHELRLALKPPSDSETKRKVEDLRKRIAAVNVLTDARRFGAALDDARALLVEARKTNYCPVIAEALLARGNAGTILYAGQSKTDLQDALFTAERCGHDRVVAMAGAGLIYADREAPEPVPETWARMTEAVLQRTGGDPHVEAWLFANRASVEKHRGEREAAVADYRKALNLEESLFGPDHAQVGLDLMNLSDALKEAGKLDEAVTTSDRALQIMKKWVGPDHVDVAYVVSNRGDLLATMHRYAEAEQMYRDALRVFDRDLASDDSRKAYPLAGLGQVLLAEGHRSLALPELERALKLAKLARDPYLRASIEFGLADALCPASSLDCGRAIELAQQALSTYSAASGFWTEQQQVSAWLKARDASARPPLLGRQRRQRESRARL